jgi:hypothetical protein
MRAGDPFVPTHQNIREICARLLLAQDEEQFQATLSELKIAMHDHATSAENRGLRMILEMPKSKLASGE